MTAQFFPNVLAQGRRFHRTSIFHVLSANVLTNVLAAITMLVVAGILTPAELADIRILQGYTIIAITLAGMGYTAALLKTWSERGKYKQTLGLLGRSLTRTFAASLIVYISLVILIHTGLFRPSEQVSVWLPVFSIIVPLVVSTEIFKTYLHSRRAFRAASKILAVARIIGTCAILAATAIFGFVGFIVGSLFFFALSLVMYSIKIIRKHKFISNSGFPKSFHRFAVFSLIGNLFVMFGEYGDIILLDALIADRGAIGDYALASILIVAAMQVTGAVQTVALPNLVRRITDRKSTLKYFLRTQSMLAIASLCIAGVGYELTALLVPWVYGSNYANVPVFLIGLLAAYILNSSYSITSLVIWARGRAHISATATGLGVSIALLSGYLLVPAYGIWGMIYGKIIGSSVIFLLITIFAMREISLIESH